MSEVFDGPALRSHERLVQEFLSSVDGRRRRWVDRRHTVQDADEARTVSYNESPWDPELLDALMVTDGPVHRAALPAKEG